MAKSNGVSGSLKAATAFSLALAWFQAAGLALRPGTLAFDANDDACHTFVNLKVAREALAAGKPPLMNVYNGFGTPLAGDTLTFPFALHSWTYALFPGPLAMTLNRFFVSLLTAWVLLFYFRRRLAFLPAAFAAFLCFFQAGRFWTAAHHQYQTALLWFVLLLTAQEDFSAALSPRGLTAVFACAAGMVLHTNLNLVGWAFAIVLAAACFGEPRHRGKAVALLAQTLAAALLLDWPDMVLFAGQAARSVRVHALHGAAMGAPAAQLARVVAGSAQWRSAQDAALFFPLAALPLCAAGAAAFWRAERRRAAQALALGFLPLAAVWLSALTPGLVARLPLLRSTDLTRVLWFSSVFVFACAGTTVERWGEPAGPIAPVRKAVAFLMVLTVLSTLVQAGRIMGFSFSGRESVGAHYFNEPVYAQYQPALFADRLPPMSRVATDFPPYVAMQDMKLAARHVFGTQGRAPLLALGQLQALDRHGLIAVDSDQVSVVYHLKRPWNFELLRRLGVGFVVAGKGDPDKRLKVLETVGPASLYELRQPGGVAYLFSGQAAVPRPAAVPNGLSVRLPELARPDRLIVAERYSPGWRARVDGASRGLEVGADGFLRVPVGPGDREAVVEYAPVSWRDYAAGAALALLFLGAALCALSELRVEFAVLSALALAGLLALQPRLVAAGRDDGVYVLGDLLAVP